MNKAEKMVVEWNAVQDYLVESGEKEKPDYIELKKPNKYEDYSELAREDFLKADEDLNEIIRKAKKLRDVYPLNDSDFCSDDWFSDIRIWLVSLNILFDNCISTHFGDTLLRYILSNLFGWEDENEESGRYRLERIEEMISMFNELYFGNKGKNIEVTFEVKDSE
jgi:hypothetical protein